jgi:ubiquitin conjugation factor E4 B
MDGPDHWNSLGCDLTGQPFTQIRFVIVLKRVQREVAERSNFEVIWLKPLADELISEGTSTFVIVWTQLIIEYNPGAAQPLVLTEDLADRLFISRLEIDPEGMSCVADSKWRAVTDISSSDDLEFLPVLASLPKTTLFEYLVNAWKRLNTAQTTLAKRKHLPMETQQANAVLDKLRDLIISYAGLTLQDPQMFPQPHDANESSLGAPELVRPLLALSALSGPLSSFSSNLLLSPQEVVPFLNDLSARFYPSGELPDVMGPVFRRLLLDPSLIDPAGLLAPDAAWRRILAGLEALVSIKGGPEALTSLPEWIPEFTALLGPLMRLGVIQRDWPHVAKSYFSDIEKRSQADVDSSFASLRGTTKSLQGALFGILNTLVRAGAGPRTRVLEFFAAVVRLNGKRAGLQVDAATVASDSFMLNAQSVLLRFAEPFMDSRYSKLDRVDGLYFARSKLIDLKDETRINATAQEASQWASAQEPGPAPNFISDVFFLTVATSHYGMQQTIRRYEDSLKHYDELRNHIESIEADNSWMGTPFQARTEASLRMAKEQRSQVGASQFAYRTALEDPEFAFRSLAFANFVSTWILRFVDPKKTHPDTNVELPLPDEVPLAFRSLPEYMFEDVVETLLFYSRYAPNSLALNGKNEIVVFAVTFLVSTWYIKNPFLKSKLIEVNHHFLRCGYVLMF